MNTGAPTQTRERRTMLGAAMVKYGCSCGYTTGWWTADYDEAGKRQMAEHLVDAHGDELKVGRCAGCGTPTDHFRAETPFGDVYACETHSPAMRDGGPQ